MPDTTPQNIFLGVIESAPNTGNRVMKSFPVDVTKVPSTSVPCEEAQPTILQLWHMDAPRLLKEISFYGSKRIIDQTDSCS